MDKTARQRLGGDRLETDQYFAKVDVFRTRLGEVGVSR